MKVAYIFSTQGHSVSYKLGQMILPQLENDAHGVEVVGMFFFEDSTFGVHFHFFVSGLYECETMHRIANKKLLGMGMVRGEG